MNRFSLICSLVLLCPARSHIRSKEKDLALLATIPPDQYLDFERLRRANGAKAIQRNFRAMQQYSADGTCLFVCVCACVYVCVHVCMYVCMVVL